MIQKSEWQKLLLILQKFIPEQFNLSELIIIMVLDTSLHTLHLHLDQDPQTVTLSLFLAPSRAEPGPPSCGQSTWGWDRQRQTREHSSGSEYLLNTALVQCWVHWWVLRRRCLSSRWEHSQLLGCGDQGHEMQICPRIYSSFPDWLHLHWQLTSPAMSPVSWHTLTLPGVWLYCSGNWQN